MIYSTCAPASAAPLVAGKSHRLGSGIQTECNRGYRTVRIPNLDAAIVPRLGKVQRKKPVGNFGDPCQCSGFHSASPPHEPERNKQFEPLSQAKSPNVVRDFSGRHATRIGDLAPCNTLLGRLRLFTERALAWTVDIFRSSWAKMHHGELGLAPRDEGTVQMELFDTPCLVSRPGVGPPGFEPGTDRL